MLDGATEAPLHDDDAAGRDLAARGGLRMASPTGVIPEKLMMPQSKRQVIDFLMAAPLPAVMKREFLLERHKVAPVFLE